MANNILGRALYYLIMKIVGSQHNNTAYSESAPHDGVLLDDLHLESANIMGGIADYSIYLPADYKTSGKKYPVVYLFHGMGDNNTKWDRKGCLCSLIDEAVRSGRTKPFIAVMTNGYLSFYVDGCTFFDGQPGHRYETFFVSEFQPFIEANYPVSTERSQTAIAGMSMGGYGAAFHAFSHPEKYCFCYSMSGALTGINWTRLTRAVPSLDDIIRAQAPLDDIIRDQATADCAPCRDTHLPTAASDLALPHAVRFPDLVMECGDRDPLTGRANKKMHKRLEAMSIPHRYIVSPGAHTWPYWQGCIRRMLDSLPF